MTIAPKFSGPRPIVPGFAPVPLFQWYVVIEFRHQAVTPIVPYVVKLGGLPPFCTPPPFELSNSFTCEPRQTYVGFAGLTGFVGVAFVTVTVQKPWLFDAGFCDQLAGSESWHE